MAPKGRVMNGPYGGMGGSYYNAEHGSHKIKKINAWGRSYAGYDVLNGFQFTFDDNHQGPLVGHINENDAGEFEFRDGEKISSMHVHAGDGEGFVNGFEFDTNQHRHFEIGGKEGKDNDVPHLGNGDWIAAEGRDPIHGADAVVDNIDIYFST
ncbi:hypothetical protein ASPVEDRAFT_34609 [Aspergillus versicolor CBS 583.65]|uniref:Jacalin-type lectin domain-containing protein n=1 Tax=Aspergillus versicolor CBS 583.65 TaxID=1036611 RepID=A0A1L9Q3W5_ASPVE|nr:uncharacterized protein ASPVEDRAFT_34609 [Aspergillus versicolor CBS 583.65]OJJ08460.1 hypothetical protein ASPVEDRAFT_34609 [Aspergillus versicolor CBS 583.65]